MSGFDNVGVDTQFFAPICAEVTATEVRQRVHPVQFPLQSGYGDPAKSIRPILGSISRRRVVFFDLDSVRIGAKNRLTPLDASLLDRRTALRSQS